MLYLGAAAAFGFACGGHVHLGLPIVAELFGLSSRGVILWAVVFSGTIRGTIGSVLAGHIFDIIGSYQVSCLICVILSAIGIILTILLRPTKLQWGRL